MRIYKIETEFATFEMDRTRDYTSVSFKTDDGDIVHKMFSDEHLHCLHAEDYVKRMSKQLMVEAKLKEYIRIMGRPFEEVEGINPDDFEDLAYELVELLK